MGREEGGRWDVGIQDNAVRLERISDGDERLFDDSLSSEEARDLAGLLTKFATKLEEAADSDTTKGSKGSDESGDSKDSKDDEDSDDSNDDSKDSKDSKDDDEDDSNDDDEHDNDNEDSKESKDSEKSSD
ncbi:hypothetical protein A5753_18150 [Mycobacterium sp. 852002-51971_SCH5477799-a]|uniref:hypothetical protein n=1 Tax=Mycobacterium sp. 852002-51971_SCH5477799-a TaxID=1834106 RepID=UPI0007FC65A9|nr:hypothetical protein [Mycobacterium sp. 852002-51971_SCH5477799-a]OBF61373.1 hypothetical protein A5753_18150 [Mycobacterium sp. 852002-51971_SCH5477799-a]